MNSVFLLGAIGALIALPGIAAALAAYGPGEISIVTRLAAVFGLGFTVAGGCAFLLVAADIFWLRYYIPLWLIATAVLWVMAIRRASLRDQFGAIRNEFSEHRAALVIGGVVILAMLGSELTYLHNLPGAHYVYFLNGMEIANSHGVPNRVLEYGQAWPPATDKVFLDAFTGVLALLTNNPLTGPGVLLWLAFAGAAIGLWAFAWELGLRLTGALLPVLMLADTHLVAGAMTNGFHFYRAEDFGMAVAFCALALGVAAIKNGGTVSAVMAGIVLAAGSGTHLVPIVIVVIILGSIFVAELVRRGQRRPRRQILRLTAVVGGSAALLGLVIRLLAGGALGLGGASNESAYSAIRTWFDPTAYMYSGARITRTPPETNHFYRAPGMVIQRVIALATGRTSSQTGAFVILGVIIVLAIGLMLTRSDLADVGFVVAGLLLGVIAIALYFSFRYDVWVEATFGLRRPTVYVPMAVILLSLGFVEFLLPLLGKLAAGPRGIQISAWVGLALVVIVAVLLVPGTKKSIKNQTRTTGQRVFATWARTETPCGARFLINERSEGSIAALTGRYALDEGMGSFLRPNTLPHVIGVLVDTSDFFKRPNKSQSLLRAYKINYVVWAKPWLLGYPGPIARGSTKKLDAAPFLKLVESTPYFRAYRVTGSKVDPVSPLLKGHYLQCRTSAAQY